MSSTTFKTIRNGNLDEAHDLVHAFANLESVILESHGNPYLWRTAPAEYISLNESVGLSREASVWFREIFRKLSKSDLHGVDIMLSSDMISVILDELLELRSLMGDKYQVGSDVWDDPVSATKSDLESGYQAWYADMLPKMVTLGESMALIYGDIPLGIKGGFSISSETPLPFDKQSMFTFYPTMQTRHFVTAILYWVYTALLHMTVSYASRSCRVDWGRYCSDLSWRTAAQNTFILNVNEYLAHYITVGVYKPQLVEHTDTVGPDGKLTRTSTVVQKEEIAPLYYHHCIHDLYERIESVYTHVQNLPFMPFRISNITTAPNGKIVVQDVDSALSDEDNCLNIELSDIPVEEE